MAGSNGNTNWEQIQQGVSDTERLIGQRDYNSAMMKARQTLEQMVKQQAQRACISDVSDLKDLIDTLYENRWISKTTCEHYHSIRMIGNKAAHNGGNSAYDANQAYHMLSQEVYTFANDYRNARKGTRTRGTAKRPSSAQTGNSASSASRPRPASAAAARSRKQPAKQRRKGIDMYTLLKLLVPILSVILLICVIRLWVPELKKTEEPTEPSTVTTTAAPVPETTVPETMAPALYRTTTVLNVRSQPTTDGDPIGKLAEGTTVDFVEVYDDEWTIIRYNGAEAYVASRYLTTE